MRNSILLAACSMSALAISLPAWAQDAIPQEVAETQSEDGTIIVTARRRDEALQDVPLVVNVVTGTTLQELGINDFEDIDQLVPGLDLQAGNIAPEATLRGVNFDPFVSSHSATVEFYLNDAPTTSQVAFQSQFDIGQIEVLRGPQGTLRGRASPSGSITIGTRKPNLREPGGYISGTIDNQRNRNAEVALNIPIAQDIFGVRLSGKLNHNDGNRVNAINSDFSPRSEFLAGRISALFTPTDSLTFQGMFQRVTTKSQSFLWVESANLVNPTLPASPTLIRAEDRLALGEFPTFADAQYTTYNLSAEWRVAGQALNYVGIRNEIDLNEPPTGQGAYGSDPTDFFGPTFLQPQLQRFGQELYQRSRQESHEIRLSSVDRVAGIFDYVVGAMQNKTNDPILFNTYTIAFTGSASPTSPVTRSPRVIVRNRETRERSIFGNLTAHIGDRTELSGGLRHIRFKAVSSTVVGTLVLPGENIDTSATIYKVSAKHRFNDSLMVYASVGSSWRPGPSLTGVFSAVQTPLLRSFIDLPAERSTSYEIGFKSNWLDDRLRFNATYYHQKFNNYPFAAPGSIYYIDTVQLPSGGLFERVTATGSVAAAVPLKVQGIEVDASFQATPNWNISATFAYADGSISGTIPCNDYAPRDGRPDTVDYRPSIQEIRTVSGDLLTTCAVSRDSATTPPWSATIRSQYNVSVSTNVDAFVRGLVQVYGKTNNDPDNPYDDVSSHALVNLYAGLRSPDGRWELTGFVRNLFNVVNVANRSQSPVTVGYNIGSRAVTVPTTYRSVSLTDGRSFGLLSRFSFGSR